MLDYIRFVPLSSRAYSRIVVFINAVGSVQRVAQVGRNVDCGSRSERHTEREREMKDQYNHTMSENKSYP
jgi:hypothetical protein